MSNKGFVWNPSNCECECDKACDVGEYLDYEHCKSSTVQLSSWFKTSKND